MAEIKEPQKVLPVVGLLFTPAFDIEVCAKLESILGKVVLESETMPFNHTEYYGQEMGDRLVRQWRAFDRLIIPDTLADLKRRTIEIEKKHLNQNGGRTVNIDPGSVSLSNLILASTKNYSHRIYLGKGIYAEVTLIYKQKNFVPLDWTYPDYREENALDFFTKAREILKNKLTTYGSNVSKE
ncbi:MAG: DUF4416 family protein [candidate division WOR-3 bacterium]|nr:MAG: DUF4416 family protein [candidate division WOR-3 bacterium]